MKTRCSALPVVTRCPAAIVPPTLTVDPAGPDANLGAAVHEWLASRISGLETPPPETVAQWLEVDPEETARLCWSAWRSWEKVREHFPQPTTEVPLWATAHGLTLTGHVDVLAGEFPEVRILDWKTGSESDWLPQLQGYAWLALQKLPDYERVYAAVLLVREQELIPFRWTREELDSWFRGLVQNLQDTSIYRPGAHCRYCRRAHECPARTEQLCRDIDALLHLSKIGWTAAEVKADKGAIYADALDMVRLVEDTCHIVREGIRTEVALAGGRLDAGGGRELVLRRVEQHGIDVAAGWITLLSQFGSNLPAKLKLSKAALYDLATELAPPRGKKAAMEAIMAELAKAGAVTTKITEPLDVRRTNLPITKETT